MHTASISQLQHFFESYADCLGCGDARGISQLFAVPCLMVSDEKSSAFTEAHAIEVLFLQGFSFLKKHGIAMAKPDVRSRRMITPNIVQATVQWRYFDSTEKSLYDCDYIYMLHLKAGMDWKIETAISINEKERMQKIIGQ